MASTLPEPLLPKPAVAGSAARSKASLFYGASEYEELLKVKHEEDHEITALKNAMPDESQAGKTGEGQGKVLAMTVNNENRSPVTGRLFPTPKKPDPMPDHLAFFFAKVTAEQMMYQWNFMVMVFCIEILLILGYCGLLAMGVNYWVATIPFLALACYTGIQHIYICHDVMHGATFPPYDWQKFVTHPFSDFFSLCWEDFVLEHNRHHASTVDLLCQGEFGWDPEEFQYGLLKGPWYKLIFTVPFMPLVHFFGLNDTGAIFACEWYMHFPDSGPGGKCNKEFWKKWFPRRMKHHSFVLALWALVWLLGTFPLGRPLSEGWRFVLPVTTGFRLGYSAAWIFITNFNHSIPWNNFLANDPVRNWPVLHEIMALVLGGKHRWNEMLFHDVHHAFPNAVGTMSQRGRFHGWQKVHDAGVEVLSLGLWEDNGDEETEMQKKQRKRSMLIKERMSQKK